MDGFGRRCASTRRNSGIHSDPPGSSFSFQLFSEGLRVWCWPTFDHDSDKRHRRFWGFFCGFYLGDIPWPLNQNKIINIWWYVALLNAFVQWKNGRFFFAKKTCFKTPTTGQHRSQWSVVTYTTGLVNGALDPEETRFFKVNSKIPSRVLQLHLILFHNYMKIHQANLLPTFGWYLW